jgi:hypothetical protein
MICAICLDNITKSATGTCNHHFCYNCLIKWCKLKNKCPKCNFDIFEIKLDPEFDSLISEICNFNYDSNSNSDAQFSAAGHNIDTSSVYSAPISSPSSPLKITTEYTRQIILYYSNNHNFPTGITLSNNTKGPGVIVKKISHNFLAYKAGFKVGDIILFINSVPCINHKQSIQILDTLYVSYKNAICTLL